MAACVISAFFIGKNPEDSIHLLLLLAGSFLIWHKPKVALYLTIFLPVVGELYRLNFGPENRALISDLFIPLFIGLWLLKKYFYRLPLPKSVLTKPLLLFIAAAIISLLQALLFLKPNEVLISSFYLIRYAEYALLFLITQDLIKTEKETKRLTTALFTSAALIAVAGFVQLVVYPDLGKLEEYGWDPHINRLVSTWLDPNFVGGLLAFITTIILSISVEIKNFRQKTGLLALAALLAGALFLTYSRSAYLALAAGILIVGLLKSRKLLLACLLIFMIGISISPRAEERIEDLTGSIASIIFNTSENPDATARLRIKDYEQTLSLVARRPLLGSGYNTLRYVKFNEGMVSDPKIHSAGGSDSSLLTILATTGLLGLIPFLWLHFRVLSAAFKKSAQKNPGFTRGLAFGLFAGLCSLLVHSLFVNSLLFPQILIFLWITVGIVINVTH